jgi:hypothetical protein
MAMPKEPEFESGQILVDKERCWPALQLSLWFNANSDFYYQYLHGDKETFHLAFRKLKRSYTLVPTPIQPLERTMCQHDFEGRRLFQHRNCDKWDLLLCNRRIEDFWFETECRSYLRDLQQKWDGGLSRLRNGSLRRLKSNGHAKPITISAVMISCAERAKVREQTLSKLAQTDWADWPLHVQLDASEDKDYQRRQTECAFHALQTALAGAADYVLFLEDDLDFNLHLRHNLEHWPALRTRPFYLGGLYNPRLCETACDVKSRSRLVSARLVFGSQALLLSRPALNYVLTNWNKVRGMQDIRISRLAGRLHPQVLYHAPSLVQHTGSESVCGSNFHQAGDFDRNWRAEPGELLAF